MMKIDKKIIKALKQQDEKAFDYVYYEFNKLIYHVIYSMVKDSMLTEELVSDAFVKMYQSIDMFNEENNFKYWFLQIAKNLTKNKIRDIRKDKYVLSEEMVNGYQGNQNIEYDIFCQNIHLYLSEEEVEIVNMHILFDISFKDIADHLDQTISAVSNKYYRALEKLKEVL